MRNIILFLFLHSIIFSLDLSVNIFPDTIFVGSLVNIKLKIENNFDEKVFIFNDIEEDLDNYILLNKKLFQNSVEYTLQFLDAGYITIPPISIDIQTANTDVMRIKTDSISIYILSNIISSEAQMKSIKPMIEFELISKLTKIVFLIILIMGVAIGILIWNTKRNNEYEKISKITFTPSKIGDSIKQIEELPLPENINSVSTEKYYLALSNICRSFLKDLLYIKAIEMTSDELTEHFKLIGIEKELVTLWQVVSNSTDMSKYAKQIPHIDQFTVDKNNFINLMKSFNKINSSKYS